MCGHLTLRTSTFLRSCSTRCLYLLSCAGTHCPCCQQSTTCKVQQKNVLQDVIVKDEAHEGR